MEIVFIKMFILIIHIVILSSLLNIGAVYYDLPLLAVCNELRCYAF